MTTATLPYDLPDLRPFRAIQNRMRIQGGSVVTGNGVLQSENYDGTDVATGDATEGWRIEGTGLAEFLDVLLRGELRWPGGRLDQTDGLVLSASGILGLPVVGYEPNYRQIQWRGPRWNGSDVELSNSAYLRSIGDFSQTTLELAALDWNAWPAIGAGLYLSGHDGTIEVTGQMLHTDPGSAAAPPWSWEVDPDTGLYRPAANQLAVSCGGTLSGLWTAGQYRAPNGSSSAPSYAFINNAAAGMALGVSGGVDTPVLVNENGDTAFLTATGNWQVPNHTTTASAANVYMGTNGSMQRSTSSIRVKRGVLDLGRSVVDKLRPVTYKMRPEYVAEGEDPDRELVGLIAEEVAAADPRLAQRDEAGEVTYFDTVGLIAHLIAEVQSLRQRVAQLEAA